MLASLAVALALAGPPVARARAEVTVTLHGEPRGDEYAWLRGGPGDAAVRRHLAAENRYTADQLLSHAALMRTLAREIEARTYVDHETVPVRRGAWLYWTRTDRRRDHAVYLRRPVADPAAKPEVVLDLDRLARGKPFMSLGLLEMSDDGRYAAYTLDESGSEDYALFIKDMQTGRLVAGPKRVTTAAWSADGRQLLYTVHDDTHRAYALVLYTRGEAGPGRVIFEEKDPRFDVSVARSRSGEWLICGSDAYTSSEVRVTRASAPAGPWTVISPRRDGHLYDVDHAGETFYVRSNDGAPNFRVWTAPQAAPQRANWKLLVPERADTPIDGLLAFSGHLALSQREGGLARLALVDLKTGRLRRVNAAPLQDVAALWLAENPEPAARMVRVHVESVHQPERTVDVDLAAGTAAVVGEVRVAPCGGGRRSLAHAVAADGTKIPYVLSEGRYPGEGPRPLLLEAYGAYGSTFDPDFDPGRCALLDRGVDHVIAWVRGGGELGEPWHAAGRRRDRLNAVNDLVAVAARLIGDGRTTAAQLVVAGDSAGGALVAGAVHARPHLFAGAVLRVPFLDAVGTMADPTAPLTTIEYEEWGDPRIREDYDVMRQWCPYSNVGGKRYPAMLVESSLADSRVAYHEQARYVARLRARATGGPFLLHTAMHAGHGGASTRRGWLEARALEVAFILDRLGLTK
jgi:oligopeptidase B